MKQILSPFILALALLALSGCGSDSSNPTDDTVVISQPEADAPIDIDDVREAIVGLDVATAEQWGLDQDVIVRVVVVDGESFPATQDYLLNRVNVVVEAGVITLVESVG